MAAALVLSGNKRSFFEDVLPSSLHGSKRLRCSSSVPSQHLTPLRRPAEENEPAERFAKRTKMTHHNMSAEEWVELFVREMSSATSVDDAKARAAKVLEVFEHGIRSRAAAAAEVVAAQKEEENMVLKQEIQEMEKKNVCLKRGVLNQNARLKELEGRNQVLEHKVIQEKERASELEGTIYGLQVHLNRAQQCNTSIPLGFHPHVF